MGNGQSTLHDERAFTDERMGTPWKGDSKLIISIDIGATHSAVVLAFLEPNTIPSIHRISHWPGQESQSFDGKVPSLLLYDLTNEPHCIAAGAKARAFQRNLGTHYYDARYFKLNLHFNGETLSSATTSTASISTSLEKIPKGLTITRIYADFMIYLLGHAKARLQETTGHDLWKLYGSNADVILTHPNGWLNSKREVLARAAVDAKLISKDRCATNLHFIEEAEAAARYCVSRYSKSFGQLKPGSQVMVCDAGGSTLDTTTYQIQKSNKSNQIILAEQTSDCISAGGVYVDMTLKEAVLKRLNGMPDEPARQKAAIEACSDFEAHAKRTFASSSDTCRIRVGTRNWSVGELGVSRGLLTFEGHEMEEMFRQASVSQILNAIQTQLSLKAVDFILLTGGFGESKYLNSQLLLNFGSSCEVIIPEDTSSLKPVAIGALMLAIGGGRIKVVPRKKKSRFVRLFKTPPSILDLEPPDNGRIMKNFSQFNNALMRLCEDLISLPEPAGPNLHLHPHFKLMSSFTSSINDEVFARLHPLLVRKHDVKHSARYEKRFRTESPEQVFRDRRRDFLDTTRKAKPTDEKAAKTRLQSSLISSFQSLAPFVLDDDAVKPEIAAIVDQAYQWNALVKGSNADHLFRPFVPKANSAFDESRMKTYYTYPSEDFDLSDARVSAVVTMGVEVAELKAGSGSLVYEVLDGGKASVLIDKIPPTL